MITDDPNDTSPRPPGVRPVFFVHVMKTGGTTVMRNLRQNFPLDQIYPYRKIDIHYEGDRLDIRRHLSLPYLLSISEERWGHIRVCSGHFPYVAQQMLPGDFRTATLLRDPVPRTMSLVRQFRRNVPWVDAGDQPPLPLELEAVYEHPLVFEPLIHNHQTKIFSMRPSDDPVTYMDVIDVDRSRLELAKENLARVDVVGITEAYDDFLTEVEEHFGWVVERGAKANATPSSEIEPIDEALRQRIVEDNALDVELYEFAKALVEQRRQQRLIGA